MGPAARLTQNTSYGEGTTQRLSGTIQIAGHTPVSLENMYALNDQPVPDGTFVAGAAQSVFARIFSNPYETPKIDRVSLRVESVPERRIATIENAWSERRRRLNKGEREGDAALISWRAGDPHSCLITPPAGGGQHLRRGERLDLAQSHGELRGGGRLRA